jgi:hypothetical protein
MFMVDSNESQKLPPGCQTYLLSMIPHWNGITGRQVILDLLVYTPIGPFEGKFLKDRETIPIY